MALNGLTCPEVMLRNYSLHFSLLLPFTNNHWDLSSYAYHLLAMQLDPQNPTYTETVFILSSKDDESSPTWQSIFGYHSSLKVLEFFDFIFKALWTTLQFVWNSVKFLNLFSVTLPVEWIMENVAYTCAVVLFLPIFFLLLFYLQLLGCVITLL